MMDRNIETTARQIHKIVFISKNDEQTNENKYKQELMNLS